MALRFRGLDAPVECVYWKGGGPPTPDPNVQITAEKSANRFNVTGPGGKQTWTQGPQVVQGYDQGGKPIYGTQDTQNIQLNPSEQRQYDLHNQISEQMMGGASSQIPDLASKPFNYDTAGHTAATAAFQRQSALLTPEFNKADRGFESRMTNAGIPLGSEAYGDALRQHENNKNFALTDAARAAEQEGTGLALSERQQRYNELAAAMGGQQLMPVGALGAGGAPLGVGNAYGAANNAQLAGYNAKVSGDNAMLGAGAGVASTAAMAAIIF